ncbi:hypothetical protein ACFE04_014621 [Oxalis oulophora]
MSSLVRNISNVEWVASSMDGKLHYPKDLFHDCLAVRSILGASAPYATPKVKSEKLLDVIGFKIQVSLVDVLDILKVWRHSKTPFKASLAQMTKLYLIIWDEMTTSEKEVIDMFNSGPTVFIPYASKARYGDMSPAIFLSHKELYSCDSTGAEEKISEIHSQGNSKRMKKSPQSKMLYKIYPRLHDFFRQ